LQLNFFRVATFVSEFLGMADLQSSSVSAKRCFVTIGATAPFNSLIKAVLAPDFIRELQQAGYTELRIQYGDHEGEAIFRSRTAALDTEWLASAGIKLEITGFGFKQSGLREEMLAARGRPDDAGGMVISHAGQ
jgi:beta-1,4-N-acetylglucosaminyltransferase